MVLRGLVLWWEEKTIAESPSVALGAQAMLTLREGTEQETESRPRITGTDSAWGWTSEAEGRGGVPGKKGPPTEGASTTWTRTRLTP